MRFYQMFYQIVSLYNVQLWVVFLEFLLKEQISPLTCPTHYAVYITFKNTRAKKERTQMYKYVCVLYLYSIRRCSMSGGHSRLQAGDDENPSPT